MKTQKRLAAFTLVELLVVVGIIGIIASLLLVSVGSAKSLSEKSQLVTD